MDALDNIPGPSSLNVNIECLEEKPWRKTGAKISDYFNYGFNEESWNIYCRKQVELRAASRELYTTFRVQTEHSQNEEEESCYACSSSYIPASRNSSLSSDVTESQPGSSVEEHRCLSDKGNSAQAVAEMYPEEDRITSYQLPPLFNFSPLFAYIPPPSLLYQRRTSPVTPVAASQSAHAKECDDPSTLLYPFSFGSVASSTGVNNNASKWQDCTWQEKCDRDTARDNGHDKESKRGRDRERESCSSFLNSRQKRMKQTDTAARGHRCHRFEGVSGVRERNRDMRHKTEGREKSSRSNRSRRDDGEDRESQSRHKHKKAKRNEKDINKLFSANRDRNSKLN